MKCFIALFITVSLSSVASAEPENWVNGRWAKLNSNPMNYEGITEACKTDIIELEMSPDDLTLTWSEEGKADLFGAVLATERNSLDLTFPLSTETDPSGSTNLAFFNPYVMVQIPTGAKENVVEADPYIERPEGRQVRSTFTIDPSKTVTWVRCPNLRQKK